VSSGFYIIMGGAVFFSSLAIMRCSSPPSPADAGGAPSWLTPYLKFFFVVSYVVLAPYVGAFADRLPKAGTSCSSPHDQDLRLRAVLWETDPLLAYRWSVWRRTPGNTPFYSSRSRRSNRPAQASASTQSSHVYLACRTQSASRVIRGPRRNWHH